MNTLLIFPFALLSQKDTGLWQPTHKELNWPQSRCITCTQTNASSWTYFWLSTSLGPITNVQVSLVHRGVIQSGNLFVTWVTNTLLSGTGTVKTIKNVNYRTLQYLCHCINTFNIKCETVRLHIRDTYHEKTRHSSVLYTNKHQFNTTVHYTTLYWSLYRKELI